MIWKEFASNGVHLFVENREYREGGLVVVKNHSVTVIMGVKDDEGDFVPLNSENVTDSRYITHGRTADLYVNLTAIAPPIKLGYS